MVTVRGGIESSRAMDLEGTIRQLRVQVEKVEIAIAELEALRDLQTVNSIVASANEHSRGRIKSKRGRKSMNKDERLEVSERMSKYWAAKRDVRPNS